MKKEKYYFKKEKTLSFWEWMYLGFYPDTLVKKFVVTLGIFMVVVGFMIEKMDCYYVKIDFFLGGDMVKIENRSDGDLDISGWELVSYNGGERLIFPEGTILYHNRDMIIYSGKGYMTSSDKSSRHMGGVINWTDYQVWNEDWDIALLFNRNKELVGDYKYGKQAKNVKYKVKKR